MKRLFSRTHLWEHPSNIFVAVLVVCNRETDKDIDYNPYWTKYRDIQLPWSSNDRKKEASKNIDSQVNVIRIGDKNSLEQKVPILRIADEYTKEGEEFDISNNDIENVINLLDYIIAIPENISDDNDVKVS